MEQNLTVAALKDMLFHAAKDEHDYYVKIASLSGHLHTQEEVKIQWQRYRVLNRVISQARLLDEYHEWLDKQPKEREMTEHEHNF